MAGRSDSVAQPLDLVILGLLARQKMHGYELHKRIIEAFGSLFRPSWGSIYPALQRMLSRGDLETFEPDDPRDLRQITGSLAAELALHRTDEPRARSRKVYCLTDSGRDRLVHSLEQVDVEDERAFWVTLYLSSIIVSTKRAAIIAKRFYLLEDRLAEIQKTKKGSDETYERLALDGMEQKLSSELTWLSDQIRFANEGEKFTAGHSVTQFGVSQSTGESGRRA